LIQLAGGKRVRVDVVGSHLSPLWCAIYTRTLPNAEVAENACGVLQINNDPIQI
jgi:hypothetical protein